MFVGTLLIAPRRSNQSFQGIPSRSPELYSSLLGAVGLGIMIPTLGEISSLPGDHAMDHGVEYGPRNVRVLPVGSKAGT